MGYRDTASYLSNLITIHSYMQASGIHALSTLSLEMKLTYDQLDKELKDEARKREFPHEGTKDLSEGQSNLPRRSEPDGRSPGNSEVVRTDEPGGGIQGPKGPGDDRPRIRFAKET